MSSCAPRPLQLPAIRGGCAARGAGGKTAGPHVRSAFLSADTKPRTANIAPSSQTAASNGKCRNRNRAAAGNLENCARAAPFFLRKLGHARHITRLFCDLETIERGPPARGSLHAAQVACQLQQTAGALDFDGFARRTFCQHRPGERHGRCGPAQWPPVNRTAHQRREARGKFCGQASGLARGFGQRSARRAPVQPLRKSRKSQR